MTDEELFKAWKSEQYKDQSTEEKMEFVEHLHTFPKHFEKTFLAGLKAGRPQWHKPSEKLPETTVLDEDGNRVFYDYKIKRWRYDDADSTISLTPTAWCEIPTFDKE